MEPPTQSPTEFRLQAKRFLLTYKTHIDKEELAKFIQRKLKCEAHVKICHETSKDGYQHTHCAVLSPKKPNIRDSRFFDFKEVHPNIKVPETTEHFKNQVKYIEKQDEDFYGDIEVPDSKEEKFQKCLDFVKSCQTWQEVLRGPLLMQMLISGKLPYFQQVFSNLARTRVTRAKYQLTDFILPALDRTRPTLLWGVNNAGKTQFALAHFNSPLLVSNVDDFNKFQEGYHDGIVVDDIDFSHWPPTALIHLLDVECDRTIKCRYRDAVIPAGTPRFFTSNSKWALSSPHSNPEQELAIERRLYKLEITAPLYNRPNNIKGGVHLGAHGIGQEEDALPQQSGQAEEDGSIDTSEVSVRSEGQREDCEDMQECDLSDDGAEV